MGATYRPLAEVRKDLRVRWYRCPLDREKLRAFSQLSDLQGWIQAGGHLALFVGTGTLAYIFWSQQSWLGFLVALWAHGTVGSFFKGVATHELGHGRVFRTKWLNPFFKYLFSLLSWWDPFDYALSHTYHHRYTRYPEADRENLPPPRTSVGCQSADKIIYDRFVLTTRSQFWQRWAFLDNFCHNQISVRYGRFHRDSEPRMAPGVARRSAGRIPQVHLVVTVAAGFSWNCDCCFVHYRPLGPSASDHFFLFHRELAGILCQSHAAHGPAEHRPRFSQKHPFDHPQSPRRVFVLADELAHRAPHVRRGSLLQPEIIGSGDCWRHARASHSVGSVAGNA